MSTSHIHYHVALAQSALFPSVVLNYSVFLGQALVSSHCNDFLIICLYVMNEMEMYHHGQTGWRCAKLPHQSQGGWEQGGMSVDACSASNVLEVKNEVDVDTVNHNAKADATR
ncbi:Protein stoned-B [Dissostichus eleginoides]|uniref:Protein stoned-B n=1 Tax=Dissostichus eleginoides TaxID=100907 RepID=A0AAD9CLY1_DISEL|nr:Protein stoned-B [Dissostichus eleginoides]